MGADPSSERRRTVRPLLLALFVGACAPWVVRTTVRAVREWAASERAGGEGLGVRTAAFLRWCEACTDHPVRLGLAAAFVVLAVDLPGGGPPGEVTEDRGS